jgi:pantoate kinase
MTARPTLPEPVEVAKFWRNRRGEAVIVSLREYEGRVLIDCRVNFTNKEGLSLVVLRLPDLAKAINKAMKQAQELGLLPDDEAGE